MGNTEQNYFLVNSNVFRTPFCIKKLSVQNVYIIIYIIMLPGPSGIVKILKVRNFFEELTK